MKLVWSPETASKAYIDTVKKVGNHANSLIQIAFDVCFHVYLMN